MTHPRAPLAPTGTPGVYAGRVDGHPAADTSVQVTRLTHDTSRIRLFQYGKQVGEGVLRLADGVYRGSCTEFAGNWHIEAKQGSAVLEFREEAPAETAA